MSALDLMPCGNTAMLNQHEIAEAQAPVVRQSAIDKAAKTALEYFTDHPFACLQVLQDEMQSSASGDADYNYIEDWVDSMMANPEHAADSIKERQGDYVMHALREDGFTFDDALVAVGNLGLS